MNKQRIATFVSILVFTAVVSFSALALLGGENPAIDNHVPSTAGNETEPVVEVPASAPANVDFAVPDASGYSTGSIELDQLTEEIISGVITSDVPERDQVLAIYNWILENLTYDGSTDKSTWIQGATQALTTRTGGNYAYYSLTRALLTRMGFDTREVQSADANHYWVMVQVDGKWYHLDATPDGNPERFLLTTAQMSQYYQWDAAGYPTTP